MEELQQKLNSMGQELALFQLNSLKRLNDLDTKIKSAEGTAAYIAQIDKRLVALEVRIKVLEEARLRQIAFNTEMGNRLTTLEKPPTVKLETKFKWPWQK